MEKISAPTRGIVFWPVGCGDSTTIFIDSNTVIQVDIRHMEKADNAKDPSYPVVDHIIDMLPKKQGKPHLSLFVLSHPDEDHCQGFADLLKRVTIGEIWFTPRVFQEYKKDLCADAQAFRSEVQRRVNVITKSGNVANSGDKVRIIGWADELKEEEYKDFPTNLISVPGTEIKIIDGIIQSSFSAFIHSPFKDSLDGDDRNETSVGLQVTLLSNDGKKSLKTLLLGDLEYHNVKEILEISKKMGRKQFTNWDILLAPHHCSKKVKFLRNSETSSDEFKEDILKLIEENRIDGGYIISSSAPFPVRDEDGLNPPHKKAKVKYETLVKSGHFICTQEHPSIELPEPIMFELTNDGYKKFKPEITTKNSLSEVAKSIGGGLSLPGEKIGYGE